MGRYTVFIACRISLPAQYGNIAVGPAKPALFTQIAVPMGSKDSETIIYSSRNMAERKRKRVMKSNN